MIPILSDYRKCKLTQNRKSMGGCLGTQAKGYYVQKSISDENILHSEWGNGYINVDICQNLTKFTLKMGEL